MTIQVLFVFVLLDAGLRVMGFPRVFRFVKWWGRYRPITAASLVDQRTMVSRTVGAVRRATRYYYRPQLDCLPRALTIFVLLRGRGVPATLSIGVKRYPFGAHAWVDCLGGVLDDKIDDWQHEPYVPILSTREPV